MTTCVPAAGGVPGLSGPPNWLTPNLHQNELDDPHWRGAAAQGFPLLGGVTEQFSFRALFAPDGASAWKLYLSFHVKVDPHLSNTQDKLYFGLRAPGAGGAIVVEVTPYGSSAANITNQAPFDFNVFQRSGTSWTSITDPTWLGTNTRAWLRIGSAPSWAVQTVVPIKSAGTITDDAGPNLTDTFGLWYYAQVWTGAAVVPYEWKPGSAASTPGSILTGEYPDPAQWDTFQLSSTGCTTGGIALRYLDIGTTNTPNSEILWKSGQTNTFFARPRNYGSSTVASGQMTARFRIANWGSIADPAAPWVNVPGGALVASDAAIAPIVAGSDPPATNPIHFNWALNATDVATFITGKDLHKCVLVDLSGPGLTFLNNSVYRNMDFEKASVLRRPAEISVVGLAPISPAPRDVYLYVETQNMPATVEQPRPEEPKPDEPKPDEPMPDEPAPGEGEPPVVVFNESLGTSDGPVIQPTFEEQTASLPTYRVHVYHDKGETVTVDGATRPVLEPQSSFGYFLSHAGALAGWRHSLIAPPEAQLQEISPNFYKIVVPNNGTVTVTTVIHALEPGLLGLLSGCLAVPINILLVIFRWILKALEALRDLLP
jgi:hypothetical protein